MFYKLNCMVGLGSYIADLHRYKCKQKALKNDFAIDWRCLLPFIYEKSEEAGAIPHHYFIQDLWAAQKVYASKVSQHYDFGSRLDGFISHCLIFCNVTMIDIRPLHRQIEGLSFMEGDITCLSAIPDNSIGSLSSLHAVEHIGLGRYGDTIDPEGYRKAIHEIKRVLQPGGNLYFSVPVGRQKLYFNAHRVFDPTKIREFFLPLCLIEFSFIDDDNHLVQHADIHLLKQSDYACGLFHFTK